MPVLDQLAADIASGDATPARVYGDDIWLHATHAYSPPELVGLLESVQRLVGSVVANLHALRLRPTWLKIRGANEMLEGSRWPDMLAFSLAHARLLEERHRQLAGHSKNKHLRLDAEETDDDPVEFVRLHRLRYNHGRIIDDAITPAAADAHPVTEPAVRACRSADAATWREAKNVTLDHLRALRPSAPPTLAHVPAATAEDTGGVLTLEQLSARTRQPQTQVRRNEQLTRELLTWRAALLATFTFLPATSSKWEMDCPAFLGRWALLK